MREIIEKLRDDEEYYKGIGKYYLSNSDIGTLLQNPKEFRSFREDSKHFMEGRLFHQMILEPHKVDQVLHVDVSTRTTKAYKEFCEANGVEVALLTKEVSEVEKMVSTIKSNLLFYDDIYKDGNLYEEPMLGEIMGVTFKGKADIVTDEYLIDLKTTSDINKFKWSAKAYNYDSQCFIYQKLFGKPLYFYVIDKETHQLGVFRPSPEFVEGGESKVARAIEVYNTYFSPTSTENIKDHFINEIL